MEKWHRALLDQMQAPAPPGFRRPTMELLRADRAAWVRMAEKVSSLKRKGDGTLPLNAALDELQLDPSVMFHLVPLPLDRASVQGRNHSDTKLQDDPPKLAPRPKNKFGKPHKGSNKGKGKGKSKPTSKGKMPTELIGLHQQTKSGKRMCYNYNLARKAEQLDRGVKRSFGDISSFAQKLSDRVNGILLSDLIFIEIFSGTAGLTAEVRRMGCQHSTGIDAHVTKQVKAPVIRIDLSLESGQTLLWRILSQPRVFGIHLGPPCGTSSRAREIKRHFGRSPPPLRSVAHPDGRPNLSPRDQARVDTANLPYKLSGEILAYATAQGILCTLENPARSHMWNTSFLQDQIAPIQAQLYNILFHHCAFGSKRRKRTKLLANHLCFQHLCRECDGAHEHLPCGYTPQGWATALEVEYPIGLCREWANCLREVLLAHGALDLPQSLQAEDPSSLQLQAKASLGLQPRGKRLRPLMREFAYILKVYGPKSLILALPDKTQKEHVLPPLCYAEPPCFVLPASAKQFRAPVLQGGVAGQQQFEQTDDSQQFSQFDEPLWKVEYGIAWDPQTFVACAAGMSHPGHFLDGVHDALKNLFVKMATRSPSDLAMERTEAMRKWVARFRELKEHGVDGLDNSPAHAKKILERKNLQLFDELVKASGSPDTHIASDIAPGFDLMGPIPSGGIFQSKPLHATLLPEQVREMAKFARDATWSSVRRGKDNAMCKDIYNSAKEECERGWMRGPFPLGELRHDAILTRRFGVQQTATLPDGSRVSKFRPIDDFSESLINVTNSCDETISPMGIVKRMRTRPKDVLVCKTIDLRKAYKNLPISESALNDAFICVLSPETGEPEAFQTLVLPFGARAAVMGFL
eukprot:s1265_g28.t1